MSETAEHVLRKTGSSSSPTDYRYRKLLTMIAIDSLCLFDEGIKCKKKTFQSHFILSEAEMLYFYFIWNRNAINKSRSLFLKLNLSIFFLHHPTISKNACPTNIIISFLIWTSHLYKRVLVLVISLRVKVSVNMQLGKICKLLIWLCFIRTLLIKSHFHITAACSNHDAAVTAHSCWRQLLMRADCSVSTGQFKCKANPDWRK